MKILPINNINFQACKTMQVNILKKNSQSNEYDPYLADLVEFDINNSNDMQKIKEISKLSGFALYGYEIYQSLLGGNNDVMNSRCFALVNDFQNAEGKIENDNILGLFTFREIKEPDKPDEIALFITNQKYRTRWYRDIHDNKFMHIGKEMAQAMQKIFPNKSIKCYSEIGAVEFWKKNGFKEIAERKLILKR